MKTSTGSYFLLKLSLSLMFIAIGIAGITGYNSGLSEFARGVNQLFGRSNSILPLVMAIIELLAGVLLLLSIFSIFPSNLTSLLLLIILIFWAVTIILQYFINGFLKPDFIPWLGNVSVQLVILSGLWLVYSETR